VERGKTPSAEYLLFDKDNVIHKFKTGFVDIKNQKKVSDDTTYHAFSVTKTFTALAVMQLAEEKKVDLDESVKKYVPEFPYGSEISVRNLLTHTAGIPNPNPLSWIHLEKEHAIFDSKGFFDSIFKKHNKAKSKPNEKFRYSNLGYVLLGRLIETISGQAYENYIRHNILEPLEISPKELGFEIVEEGNLATGYQKKTSLMNLLLGFFIDKPKFMAKAEGKWKPVRRYQLNGASYGGWRGTPMACGKCVLGVGGPRCRGLADGGR
jgi:CubicO group peptidase (beta-lactamase class C family)